jgi:hypothetical protein
MPPNEGAGSNPDTETGAQESSTTDSSSRPGPSADSHIASGRSPSEELTPAENDPTSALAISSENEEQTVNPSGHNEPFPKDRRKRVRLGEALRKQGIDEHAVAAGYADVMGELQSKPKDTNADKLLVDILKHCGKILEQEDAPVKPESDAHSIPVVVLRSMLRPQRGPRQGGDKSGSRS